MISQKEFDDAMADLVKAEAEIERLRAEREWRPIETLPDSGIGMIIYLELRDGKLMVGLGYKTVSGGWCDTESGFKRIDPTHWQPLPDPPEDR
jgi:hypothetical protein